MGAGGQPCCQRERMQKLTNSSLGLMMSYSVAWCRHKPTSCQVELPLRPSQIQYTVGYWDFTITCWQTHQLNWLLIDDSGPFVISYRYINPCNPLFLSGLTNLVSAIAVTFLGAGWYPVPGLWSYSELLPTAIGPAPSRKRSQSSPLYV